MNSGKENQKKNQDTINFETAIYRVLHERSNIPVPFAEQLNLQFLITFTHVQHVGNDKSK